MGREPAAEMALKNGSGSSTSFGTSGNSARPAPAKASSAGYCKFARRAPIDNRAPTNSSPMTSSKTTMTLHSAYGGRH
jgi:hypothetical protein